MKNKRICAIPALNSLVNLAMKVLRLVEVNDQRDRASVHTRLAHRAPSRPHSHWVRFCSGF